MTIEDVRISFRKYLGQYGIHGLTVVDSKVQIYHEGEIPNEVKLQFEAEAMPHLVEYQQDFHPEPAAGA